MVDQASHTPHRLRPLPPCPLPPVLRWQLQLVVCMRVCGGAGALGGRRSQTAPTTSTRTNCPTATAIATPRGAPHGHMDPHARDSLQGTRRRQAYVSAASMHTCVRAPSRARTRRRPFLRLPLLSLATTLLLAILGVAILGTADDDFSSTATPSETGMISLTSSETGGVESSTGGVDATVDGTGPGEGTGDADYFSTGGDDSTGGGDDNIYTTTGELQLNSSSTSMAVLLGSSSSGASNCTTTNCTWGQQTSSTGDDEVDVSSSGTHSSIIVGRGGSSFGSTDAIFLTTVVDVWIEIILWTMVFTAFAFVGASFRALHVNRTVKYMWLWLPTLQLFIGASVGFMHGAVSAALISAASISIPYPVGIDIAAGLGIGQAICIVYFHLGRADFIHR